MYRICQHYNISNKGIFYTICLCTNLYLKCCTRAVRLVDPHFLKLELCILCRNLIQICIAHYSVLLGNPGS